MSKPAWRNLLLFLIYAPVHWLVLSFADIIWHPPAGIRFAFMLLLPPRWWLPMAVWLMVFYRLVAQAPWPEPFHFLLVFAATSFGPFLLHWRNRPELQGARSWVWLLLAISITALNNAIALTIQPEQWARGLPHAQLFLQVLVGDCIGMLMTVPLILAVVRPSEFARQWPGWKRELPSTLLMQCVLVLLLRNVQGDLGFFLAAGLLLPPAAWLAFRGGWRGAACGLSAASMLIAMLGRLHGDFSATREGQILLIVAGTILLLLGVAVDSLRTRERELAQRNLELIELAERLRDTARRNQTQADDLRRWITGEVHDEVGQNLTALQLQIRHAENDSGQPQLFAPMREIVGHMRHSVSTLLNQLRPAGIDEFGLHRTLAEGSVAELLHRAGVRYRFHIAGDADALDALTDEVQVSLYRIVQETATNALRHSQATRFSVHFRVYHDDSKVRVILRCADNGGGISPNEHRVGGLGMNGINDRVLSFGGRLRVKSNEYGTRILTVIAFS